jgi:radical SAM superfamily enzyme YgiQ (UPF0313 family)
MKILFLYPKWTSDYGLFAYFAKRAGVWPPLNLAYLAAIAENLGHEVRIIDAEAENLTRDEMVDKILNFQPNLVGMTATTPFFHFVEEAANLIKEKLPEVSVLLGGAHITVLKEKAFKDCFDYGFIGEADEAFPAFLKKYDSREDIRDILGILFRDGEDIRYTGDVAPVMDMDSLLLPAYHLLKMEKYKIGTLHGMKNFVSIMTVRGCPYKCIFCSTKVFGKNVRRRSPELVVEEIKHIKKQYNINHFIFSDDTLTMNREHILKICELIIKENIGITFEGGTRANLVDEEIIAKLSEAGMIRICFGLESVDENIRKLMCKEIPLESYIIANKITNKYGLETLNSCMIGLPGETKETIKKTLSFLRDSRGIKQANLSIAVPYPGTELYDMAKNELYGLKLIIDDFSKFRRYNSAVMRVGDLSPNELIQLQNDAFASIYLAPWRWKPVLNKSGILGLILTFGRLIKSMARGRFELIFVDSKYWKLKSPMVKQ